MLTSFNYFKSILKRFSTDRSGNVAIVFGLSAIPIFSVIGVSIDYGRAAAARSTMQAAADSAALMIAREANGLSPSDLKKKAEAYYRALLDRPDMTITSVQAIYTTDSIGQSIKLDASGSIPNSFMSASFLGGIGKTDLKTSATARWGARYRIAIALDNTGSMASASKMTELKKAAANLVNDFAGMAKTSEDIYISIVPFSVDVNVGTDNVNQNWLNWDYFGQCYTSKNKVDPGKTNKPACDAASQQWKEYARNTWTGCVPDRDNNHIGNHDLKNTLPNVAVKETLYDPVKYSDCPVSMMGMTSVYSRKQELLTKIDSMIPKGNTNQGIGLHWAWMTHIIGAGPFPAPVKTANLDYKDVIILLSDGDNTENRWSENGNTIDNRQNDMCNNLKSMAPSMEIYTVQVATAGDAVQPVLKNCSSKPTDPVYFSYITNSTQLTTKFRDIFESIARLRISS